METISKVKAWVMGAALAALAVGGAAFAVDPPTTTPNVTTGVYAFPLTDVTDAINAGITGFFAAFGTLLKANIMIIVSVMATLAVVGLLVMIWKKVTGGGWFGAKGGE